jgi:streptomycin 6-kinase
MMDAWKLARPHILHAGVESIVIAVEQAGSACVLKLMVEARAYRTQKHILTALDDAGHDFVPRVLAFEEVAHALLMQRIDGSHPENAAALDGAVRQRLELLHACDISGDATLSEYWTGRMCRTRERMDALDSPNWQRDLVERAGQSMNRLIDGPPVLLHGDLHVENMLVCGSGKLVLIDFWGLNGPADFDYATWIVKSSHHEPDPVRVLRARDVTESELQWLAALAPSQAISLAYYDAPREHSERIWELACHLSDRI